MNRSLFYDTIRGPKTRVFGKSLSQDQVEGIEGILDAMEEVGDGRDETLCYALATAYHETGTRMVPVREGFASSDKAAIRAVHRLAQRRGPRSAVARYSQPTGPYGKTYYGRGHVQLTWLENYENCSADANTDLVKNPDAMLDPKTSARILILGLLDGRWNGARKGIEHYLPPGGPEDLKNARRTVNGTDCYEKIAGYYKDFRVAVTAAGGCTAELPEHLLPPPVPAPEPTPDPTPAPPTPEAETDKLPSIEAWLTECPGDIHIIGAWLARMPTQIEQPD